MVSPDKVNAQIPWELGDTTSISAYVRSESDDGTVMVTTPVAITIVVANPGIYAKPGTLPSEGIIYHASSYATGIVSVDGTATAGDTATVGIEDRTYTYTVQSGDTVTGIRDALVNLINQDSKVTASPSGEFQRIILPARVQGPEGNDLPYGNRHYDRHRQRIVLRCHREFSGDPAESGVSGRTDFRLCDGLGRARAHRWQ